MVPPRSVQPQSHQRDMNDPNPRGRLSGSLACPRVGLGAGVPGIWRTWRTSLVPLPVGGGGRQRDGEGRPTCGPPACSAPAPRNGSCTCVGVPWSPRLLPSDLVSVPCLHTPEPLTRGCPLGVLQDVRIFSEDGSCKVVEIPTDMTARDLCQLLVYRSHCVDDNSWTLVEHHPHLGLGRSRPGERSACPEVKATTATRQARHRGVPCPHSSRLCVVHHAAAPPLSPKPPSWPPAVAPRTSPLGRREFPRAQTQREGSPVSRP